MSLGYDSLTYTSDIAAFPDSVNALEGVCGDVRTPDKLIDQVNDTSDGRHMWLAPILPGLVGTWSWDWRVPIRVANSSGYSSSRLTIPSLTP